MSDVLMLSAIVMLVLLFLKVPVYIAVLGGSMVYFVLNPDINAVVFAQQAIIGTEKISLMAIPFFICAGIFMNYTGVTKRIMDFCEVVTGRLPGGLAQVNVLLSTVMGGLSGSMVGSIVMEDYSRLTGVSGALNMTGKTVTLKLDSGSLTAGGTTGQGVIDADSLTLSAASSFSGWTSWTPWKRGCWPSTRTSG